MEKLLASEIEAAKKVKEVREVIKTYDKQKQDMYLGTKEFFKPSINVQKSVKKTIDQKQDESITQLAINDEIANIKQNEIIQKQEKAIQQLKDNQKELTNSIDTLSDSMSKQGSEYGVEKWVGSSPFDFDQLDIIGEEAEDDEEAKPKPLITLFDNSDTEIIKKYGFDPSLNKVPDNEEIQKILYSLKGKMKVKNPFIKNNIKKEMNAIRRYQAMVKGMKVDIKQEGEGIRRYNQPKRNASKISQNGQYGGLIIDLPKLYGHLKVVAYKNGQKVYDKQADFDTLDLLTKRFNSRKNYSQLARSVFHDLNRLSRIPIHRTSKKYSKLGSGVVYYNNPQDLLSRLELLGGSMSAGNNSSDVREEFVNIVHVLNKLNVINNKQMNDLMKDYLIY